MCIWWWIEWCFDAAIYVPLLSYRLQCVCYWPKTLFWARRVYILQWLIKVTFIYYTQRHKFSWSHEMVTCPLTARECAIAFLEHSKWYYTLPNWEDQCLCLSLASFGCELKLKFCVWCSSSYLHCLGNIGVIWSLLQFTQWIADWVVESKHCVE